MDTSPLNAKSVFWEDKGLVRRAMVVPFVLVLVFPFFRFMLLPGVPMERVSLAQSLLASGLVFSEFVTFSVLITMLFYRNRKVLFPSLVFSVLLGLLAALTVSKTGFGLFNGLACFDEKRESFAVSEMRRIKYKRGDPTLSLIVRDGKEIFLSSKAFASIETGFIKDSAVTVKTCTGLLGSRYVIGRDQLPR